MTIKETVVIVIINYKTSHLMRKLLSTIDEGALNLKILILDNGSTEESFSQLQLLDDDRVILLRSEKNLGFTGGINFTLKHAIATLPQFEYFFLFNPDAFSTPGLISELIRALQSDRDAACISPQILHVDGSPWYSGACLNEVTGRVDNNPLRKGESTNGCIVVDAFSGCAALFVLDKVMDAGMFNEDLFMYYDEVELSLKFKRLGHKILYDPHLRVYHDVSYTTRNISHLKAYYMSRNKFAVFGHTMSTFNKIHFILFELAFYIKNGRFRNAMFHLRGFMDYKKGKYGALVTQ